MLEWIGALGKNLGASKAVDFALKWLESDGGKRVLEQQVTGFMGLSKVDEGIMIRLLSSLQQYYPGEHRVVQGFLSNLTDQQRAKVRETLGIMRVGQSQRINIPVMGADGKQVIKDGRPQFTETLLPSGIEFTRDDPRITFLVQLGRCIRTAPTPQEGTRLGMQMLIVTGIIMEKTMVQKVGGAISTTKERFVASVCSAFGAQDYTHLLSILQDHTDKLEEEREHKERFGFWASLPSKTLVWYLIGLAAIVYMVTTIAKLPPL